MDDRVALAFEVAHGLVLMRVGASVEAQVDEEAVAAVDGGHVDGFPVDGDHALAFLAGGFGDELLGPGPEGVDARRRDEGDLVATGMEGRGTHGGAQQHAGILGRRHGRSAGAHHDPRRIEEGLHVDARGRRRHEAEGREHRVAPSDLLHAVEDLAEAVGLGSGLHRRAGIGDGHEMLAGPLPDHGLHPAEEIVAKDVGLQGRPGFARHDEERGREAHRRLDGADLVRVGGIEDAQRREAFARAVGRGEHLRAEARSAHAEHDDVGEAARAHVLGEGLVVRDVREFVLDNAQPRQPPVLVGVAPQGLVARPETADRAGHAPGFHGLAGLRRQRVAEHQGLAVELGPEEADALARHRAEQLVGRVDEELHALLDELSCDGIDVDPGLRKPRHHGLGARDVLFDGWAQGAVIAKRVHGGGRHGVDGVAADQLLDVEHVGIGLVLGARGGPEQALRLGALLRQRLPLRLGEDPLVALVCELGVGDGDLALEGFQSRFLVGVVGLRDLGVQRLVHGNVDAADEEARHARDPGDVATLGGQILQTGHEGAGDLLVGILPEQQGDVDADPIRRERPDRRDAGGGGGHLDHQVVAGHRLMQAAGLLQGVLGAQGEIRRDFEADIAVGAVARLVDGAKHVRGRLDVGDGAALVEVDDPAVAAIHHCLQGAVILGRVADRLLEDRGVRGHPAQAVLIDEGLQPAIRDEAAGDEVEPHGLALFGEECLERVHAGLLVLVT